MKFYIPPTRTALISWLKFWYKGHGQEFIASRYTTQQMYAMFYKIRKEYDEK